MTDLYSPTAETRVIPHQAETTAVTRFEGTVRVNPPALRRPPANSGRRDTGEQPLFPTGAELAVWGPQWGAHAVAPFQEPPDGSPPPQLPPQPPAPPKVEPVTERLTLDEPRPKHHHPRHRECRCLPVTTVVSLSVGTAALTYAALMSISWQVAQ